MPTGKRLTEYEKGRIDALLAQRVSRRQIAAQVQRSHKVINSYANDKASYGTRRSTGRPQKLSERSKRALQRAFAGSTHSLRAYVREQELDVSHETLRKALHERPTLVHAKMMMAPRLTQRHKDARLTFCKSNLATDWRKVSPPLLC